MSLYNHMMDKFKNCTKSCVICDADLGYTGLKPAVCANPLCCYRCDHTPGLVGW